jgi:hypothetical protein
MCADQGSTLFLFVNWRVQIISKGRFGRSRIFVIFVYWNNPDTAAARRLSGKALYAGGNTRSPAANLKEGYCEASFMAVVLPLGDRFGRMGRLATEPLRVLFLWQSFSFL